MKKLILAILLVISAVSDSQGWASGSNTVFLPVKIRQYYVTDAAREVVVNPKLYDYLERIESRVYIARISSDLYNSAHYYLMNGYDVQVDFEGFEPIVFRYYPSVNAVVGFTSNGSPVILCSTLTQ